MTRGDWWTVGKFTLLSAVGGPLLGVILFWWLPLALSAIISRSLEDLALVSVWLFTHAAILLPSSILPAAALGALGTCLLVVLRDRDRKQREMRLVGMGYGAVAGTAMSVLVRYRVTPTVLLVGASHSSWALFKVPPVGTRILPLLGSAVAGGGTGLLLGLFIASRVRAGKSPPASNHGIQPTAFGRG